MKVDLPERAMTSAELRKAILAPFKPRWGKPGRPKVGPRPKAERLPMRPHHKGKRNG
jgi:hypothetical protein